MQASATPAPRENFVPLHADSLHDLASPVNQLTTMFDLFLKRQPSRPEGGEDTLLSLIRDAAGRLQRLVSAMQDYDRLTGLPLKIRPCEGNALLDIALALLEPAIRETGAELTSEALPPIECDPSQLGYALTALLDNAIKFHGEGRPHVHLSAARQGEDWLFSVRDNGIGIDPRHHQSVFHMFKRIHGDRYPGSGAGLAITHRVVERHGGRIWVESEPGHGSNFLFTLPFSSWYQA